MASASYPPEVNVAEWEIKKLPKASKPWGDMQLPVDILLITTIKDCEFLSCLSFLNAQGFCKSYHTKLGHVYFGFLGEDEAKLKIAVIKCNKGSTVPGGSVVVVKNAVEVLRPKAVFSVGFCGSLSRDKAKLGDVVISAKLITYAPSKVTGDDIQERGVRVPLKKRLLNLISSAGDGWKPPLQDPKELDVRVHRDGVLLSGPEVVANSARREELIQRFPEAIAIEMEGEGLYIAAHDLEIEWIVIKGVSDYADENKSKTDSWRRFASLMAASLTAEILSDLIVFENWPHYESEHVEPRPSEQPAARALPSTRAQVPVPNATVKAGCPSDDELEELSMKLGDNWKKLGGRLGFDKAKLTAFHKENEKLAEKAYEMLMDWKQREGSEGTYQVLYDALCHDFVGCKGLAETFCCL